ncbi:hypothetical protein P5V15_001491 [Pogonomyrmex californicus]
MAKQNLRRISSKISQDTYDKLLEAIDVLFLIKSEKHQQKGYVANRINSTEKSRPTIQIKDNWHYYTTKDLLPLANHLGCSRSTIYKKLYDLNMPMRAQYTKYPIMMQSYLKAKGILVPRYRVRENLNNIDPVGTASRWSQSIKRRTYKVATPNSLWHMDAHLKLSRWSFVIHGCIDGYSRLIIYLVCKTSIQAESVVKFFVDAVNNYVDVFKEICDSVYTELYSLENQGLLDVENIKHRFCVQYVYKSVINKRLVSFSFTWNIHTLGVDFSVPVVNNMNLPASSFIALLDLNNEQKLEFEKYY